MTDQEIENALARMMGWKLINNYSWYDTDGNYGCFSKDWHPLTDLNQLFMCVDKKREGGWGLATNGKHRAILHNGPTMVSGYADDLAHAIAEALLKTEEVQR
jgi:hypothetical protein